MRVDIRRAHWVHVAVLGLALNCATTEPPGAARIHGNFPSAETVDRLKSGPPPEVIFASGLRDVGDWEIAGPIPIAISAEPWRSGSKWGDLLSEVHGGSGKAVLATQALNCVAREFARIVLEYSGRPDQSMQRFILGACNSSVSAVAYGHLEWQGVASLDDGQLFDQARTQAESVLRAQAASVARPVMGVAFARDGDRAILMHVVGNQEVALEPVDTQVGTDGRIDLRGRILEPVESIIAVATRGPYDVRSCKPVGLVALPAFHVACDLDPTDRWASITLAVQRKNRLLADAVLHVLVWPQPGSARIYRRFSYGTPRAVSATESFASAFVEELNRVRAKAGLMPLSLDAGQSSTVAAVAPRFFAAAVGQADSQQADFIARGVLAGWDVSGVIKTGELAFGAVAETSDLSALLSAVLDEPLSRGALLAPGSSKIAVGDLLTESGGVPILAGIFGMYELFDSDSTAADAERVFDLLTAARAKRGVAEPHRLIEILDETVSAADDIGRGMHAQLALDDLAATASARLRSAVLTWYFETSDLATIEFPSELLSARRLGAAIGVAHRKGPKDAWGHYVVMGVSRSY